ncbi:hypothetical protein BD414DRAFT_501977 [Trametes punicea]|nr:hypothetical protein BD414DRAFT_501977 [Trametes punicea]
MFQSFSRLLLLAFLAVPAVLAAGTDLNPASVAPSRVQRDVLHGDGFNPSGIIPRPLSLATLDPARSLTNAQRLARGLPPRSPRYNTRRRALATRQSATPCALSQPTGIIHVSSADNSVNGYVAYSANSYGEYTITSSITQALEVVLLRCNSDSEPFDIMTLNGLAAYPYLGAVPGYTSSSDDLEAGSSNYAYVCGTSSVPYGPAHPAPNAFTASTQTPRDVESVIWTIDESDGNVLLPVWVNSDGTAVDGSLMHVQNAGALGAFTLTGDKQAFAERFSDATEVTLTFQEFMLAP